MRYLITIIRLYPWQNLLMLAALLLSGVAEVLGLSAMLPLLTIAIGSNSAGELAAGTAADSAAERIVNDTLSALGLQPTVEILMLLIMLAVIIKSGLVLFANKRVGFTVARVATDLRLRLLRSLLGSRWEFHLKQPVGRLANAMASEATRASKAFSCGALMLVSFIQAIVAVIVAFLISWPATLVALAASAVIFLAVGGLIRKSKKAGMRQTHLLISLLSVLTDSLQSIKPLRAMAREKSAESILIKNTTRLNRALQKQVLSREWLRALQEPLRTVFLLGGLYVALMYWQLPVSKVMVLIFLIARLLKQLGKVQQEYQRMVTLESAYWSLRDTIREAESQKEIVSGDRPPAFKHAIKLKDVSFSYGDRQVLRKVSLMIAKGKITAIVGVSGVGKTTVMDLIAGLLQPQQGAVWIDNQPLTSLDMRSWRRMIGYVPQENLLLHDTILANVTLGDPELSEDDAVDALRAANAWDFVKSLPLGLQNSAGERGGNLSGGQRQRIAIARSLVHKPQLLILDEATSGLDPASEAAVCETLQQLGGDITILVISHQSTLVEIADKVYRIQDGGKVTTDDRYEDRRHSSGMEADSSAN
jgi:ATP-binding cassette subfamily C protein